MAIQNSSLTAAEHDWYAIRSGLSANAPLGDHKLAYFASKNFGSNASLSKPLSQIEEEWLNAVAGGSGAPYEVWVKACQAQSAPVGKSVDECRFNFYNKVASGTNP